MIRSFLILLLLAVPAAAQAEWHEATSTNFIVYSEGSERDAREFAAKLERFHFVLRTFHRISAPQNPNRLRVFLFSGGEEVSDMAGAPGGGIGGYYVSGRRGLMMVGTRSRSSHSSGDPRSARGETRADAESILLHEYAHHFMFQYFPAAYPAWYREGFAEFWGATRLLDDDVVEVGSPAEDRFQTFEYFGWQPVDRLLSAQSVEERRGINWYLLYAQGWLILRYTFENPERQRQLQQYLRLINGGASYAEATRQAFTDINRFNSELFTYSGRGRFNVVRLPFRTIDVGAITLRTPGPAEQALMEREIKISQGYPQREAADFARDTRQIASRFPADPFAQRILMEAEWLAGNHDAARTVATRLLEIDPDHARALVVLGRVQVAALQTAQSTDRQAWDSARRPLQRARSLAPNDPIVLEALYDSYAAQRVLPPDEVQNGLYTAMELAPSDGDLRYKLAWDFEQRGMIPEAIAIIRPEAYVTPHRGNESERERRRREEREERERDAGQQRRETALEMLTRLQSKLADSNRTSQARN